MLSELTSNQFNLRLPECDRFSIPDPWEDTTEDFAKTVTPAIVETANAVVAPTVTEVSLHQLPPAVSEVPYIATTLLKDELNLGGKADPSFWMKMQEILAQLYWTDAICEE